MALEARGNAVAPGWDRGRVDAAGPQTIVIDGGYATTN